MTSAKALVTGASGYVGRAISTLLDSPILMDKYNDFDNPDLIVLDLVDSKPVYELIERTGPNVVIHLAASKSIVDSKNNPTLYYQNNVVSSLNLIKACEDLKIPFVFASSAAVYLEENPYSDSKAFIEKVLSMSTLDYTVLRYFNIGGLIEPPTERQTGNVFDIIRSCVLSESKFTLNSNSLPRDYTHVLDIAEVTYQAAIRTVEFGGQATYDVLSNKSTYLEDLVESYKELGVDLEVKSSEGLVETRLPIPENPYPFTPKYSIDDIVRSEIEHGLTVRQSS